MNSFSFERPTDTKSLLKCLTDLKGKNFLLISGGTDLVPQLKFDSLRPDYLVSLSGLKEFSRIQLIGKDQLRIGSRVTLSQLANDPLVKKHLPGLARAAGKVASPQIQNRATVGGNILVNNRCTYYNQSELNRDVHANCYKAGGDCCHMIPNAKPGILPLCRARYVSDLAPVFLVCEATLNIMSTEGERQTPLKEFYIPDGIDRNHLKVGEVITHFDLKLNGARKMQYLKLRIRDAIDFPSVGVAMSVQKTSSGFELGISVTGVNTHPIFKLQTGVDLPSLVEKMALEVGKEAVPLRQDFFPPRYRRMIVPVLIRKLATKLKEEL